MTMDFKDSIKQLSDRIEKLKENLQTEEATKNALIMPFLTAIGYDVFNPLEIVPEFTCDIGTKKGEKIDYAILKDGKPIILIECKHWQQDLTLYDNQLLRYFTVSNAKFGILTNGIIYKFYTDLSVPNKMDEKPFFEIDLTDIKSNQIDELKKFHKAYFDLENILNTASELKYTNALKSIINNELSNPSPELVRLFSKQVYDGKITEKLLEQFTTLVQKSISVIISDTIAERLKTALKTETMEIAKQEPAIQIDEKQKKNEIITTEEEIEGYYIVKSLIRNTLPIERIYYRDFQQFFSVLADDSIRNTICRLYFNDENNKQIGILDEEKKETRYNINSLDEIYNYSEQLIVAAKRYE